MMRVLLGLCSGSDVFYSESLLDIVASLREWELFPLQARFRQHSTATLFPVRSRTAPPMRTSFRHTCGRRLLSIRIVQRAPQHLHSRPDLCKKLLKTTTTFEPRVGRRCFVGKVRFIRNLTVGSDRLEYTPAFWLSSFCLRGEAESLALLRSTHVAFEWPSLVHRGRGACTMGSRCTLLPESVT